MKMSGLIFLISAQHFDLKQEFNNQLRTLMDHGKDIAHGSSLAIQGFQFAWDHRERVHKMEQKKLWTTLGVLGGTWLATFLLYLPIIGAFKFANWAFSRWGWSLQLALWGWLWRMSLLVPPLAIAAMNFFNPAFIDSAFFSGLRILDADLSEKMERIPRETFRKLGIRSLRQRTELLLLTAGSLFLSLIPFVRVIGIPGLQFFFLNSTLGWAPSLLLSVLAFIPIILAPIRAFADIWLSASAVSADLLMPFLSRLQDDVAQAEFLRKHRKTLVGFGLVAGGAISLPIVGPMCIGLAECAASFLVNKLQPPVQSAPIVPSKELERDSKSM